MHLHRSHRHELLWEALARAIDARPDVLVPTLVATSGRATDRAIELHLARRSGIAANLRFCRLEAVIADWLETATGHRPADRARWEAVVLAVLFDPNELSRPELTPVREWIDGAPEGARDARRASLAARMAELAVHYDRTRPAMVVAWARGELAPPTLLPPGSPLRFHHDWQRALITRARLRGEPRFGSELAEAARSARPAEGAALHVFLPPSPPESVLNALSAIDRARPLSLYVLDPCREYWEDVRGRRARAQDERRGQIAPAEDSALLSAWGRAGQRALVALYELAGWSTEDAFDDDAGPPATALEEVQRSIVERRPPVPRAPDGTLHRIAAPSIRREVEVVVSELWQRVGDGARFSELAVLVPDAARDLYLPLLFSVLAEARQTPYGAFDVPFVETSAVAAAAKALVQITAVEPTRSRLLDLLLMPEVRRPEGARTSAWAAVLDRLGVFVGLTEASTEGRGGDLEQATLRMALGAVASGERSGVTTPVGGLFPEEIDASGGETGGLYVLLASLAADLSFARKRRLGLDQWARFFGAMFSAYLSPSGPRAEAELLRVRGVLAALERRHVEGARYPVEVAAAQLVRELEAERADVFSPGVNGVTIGSLSSHRGLTTPHVFVLGLGEGQFGTGGGERGLDVSRAVTRPLDEADGERDRFLFLEALSSARRSLTVSWVARDDASGEELSPSAVLSELFEVAGSSFTEHVPRLRRHEDLARGRFFGAALPLAVLEAAAQGLGDRERGELSSDPAAPSLAFSSFARLARPDDPRRALLAWDAPPSAPATTEPARATKAIPKRLGPRPSGQSAPEASPRAAHAPVRVRLDRLRSFLERPMQAAAEQVLGRGERRRERLDEPPIAADRSVHATIVTEVVRHALEHGTSSLAEALSARVLRARARGQVPAGTLGARTEAELLSHATTLERAVRAAVGDGPDPIRPFRLGPGRTFGGEQEIALPALVLGESEGRPLHVIGESQTWLARGGRALVVVDPFGKIGSDRRARARIERMLLRAFVDHAALAALRGAAGVAGDSAKTAYVVTSAGTANATLRAIDPTVARDWLSLLGHELSRGTASFLPGEVILSERDRIVRGAPDVVEALDRAIDKARTKDDRLGELHGPVRDARHRPGPDRPELLRIVGRRFGPYFEHVLVQVGP